MDEFSIIDNFFKSIEKNRSGLVLTGIGDDAAVLNVPKGHELLVSTDTLVGSVHFLLDWPAEVIAYRALATNVSDIVAMAGTPTWCSLALTLPELNEVWLIRFSKGFANALEKFNIDLIGGDITRGPLTISITIHGIAPIGKAVKRSGAKVGDVIFTTGSLGEGAYAVSKLKSAPYHSKVFTKLFFPEPRCAYSPLLRLFANSAIDISDGLSSDLSHILKASGVGAILYEDNLPLSEVLKDKIPKLHQTEFILDSGDEYELCFTVPKNKKVDFLKKINDNDMCCYEIGEITESHSFLLKQSNHQMTPIKRNGFKHF